MTNSLGWPPIEGMLASGDWPVSPWQAAQAAILSCSVCADVPLGQSRVAASSRAGAEAASPRALRCLVYLPYETR